MRPLTRSALLLVGLSVGTLATPESAPAQINTWSFARLGFNFSPPGARSAGMGGAFVAIADDATAAETNPAGLSALLYPQASVELKAVDYIYHLVPEAGGGDAGRDFSNQRAFPSFASAVLPTGFATFALTYSQIMNYRSAFASSGWSPTGGSGYYFPFTSTLDMQIANYGGSVALKLGESLSVGATAGLSQLGMEFDETRFRVANSDPAFMINRMTVSEEGGSGSGVFVNAGALLRAGPLSLGATYKLRPKFDDLEIDFAGRSGSFDEYPTTFSLKVPDAFSGGLALRATDRLTLAVSADYTMYSQVAENQFVVFGDTASDETVATWYTADDGVDIHGGIEYVASLGQTPAALRLGVASLAASNTYYTGPDDGDAQIWGTGPEAETLQVSAGFGTVLFNHLQLDVAGVLSEQRRELITSFVIFR